jgi:hypothetical protein
LAATLAESAAQPIRLTLEVPVTKISARRIGRTAGSTTGVLLLGVGSLDYLPKVQSSYSTDSTDVKKRGTQGLQVPFDHIFSILLSAFSMGQFPSANSRVKLV